MVHCLPTWKHSGFVFFLVIVCWTLFPFSSVHAQFKESKISTSDGDPNDRFGESAAIDGTTAVLGAFRDDDAGFDAGAAYVYTIVDGVWTQQEKLVPDDGGAGLDVIDRGLFGSSIDLSNDVIVVGAIDSRENGRRIGAAYVFERDADNNWEQRARLTAFDAAANDNYAASVATNGDFVMVGALDDDHSGLTNAGAVYVYARNTNSVGSNRWELTEKIIPNDSEQGDSFGWYVAIDGNRAIIGARDVDDRAEDAGAAYIYELQGEKWAQIEKIYASDAQEGDSFGEVVAISGDQVIVGARDVDTLGEEAGAAYIFERINGSWTETAKLLASDGTSLDRFGNSVAISDDYAVVSTRIDDDFQGAMYVFQRFASNWSELVKVVPDGAQAGDLFGQAVNMTDTYIISSAKGDDDEGTDAGAAYIYELAGTDRGVLVALYNSMGGANWSRRNNWLSGADIGDWYGITTNDQGRVTSIELGANNLTGTLPQAIGSLPFLETLVLNDNNLSGAIPSDIGQLNALRVLDLSDNNLGPDMPVALSELVSLQELYLSDNAFAGAVPEKLAGLPQIEILRIDGNRLSVLPSLVSPGNLNTLDEFWVQNNAFTFEDLEPNVNLNGFVYAPQATVGEPRSETLSQGNPLVIQIPVGGQNNQYQWKKNGLAVGGATTDTFLIPSVVASDAGTYTLEITNALVPGLTLVSEPIVVSVLPVVEFEANLVGLHVIPPVVTPAFGSIEARLVGNILTVSGGFQGLTADFSSAAIHIGASNANTAAAFELSPTITDQQGVFSDGENSFTLNNEQIIALQNGLFYVEIESFSGTNPNPSEPELRSQLFVNPNGSPGMPTVNTPADGVAIDLGVPGTLEVSWNAVEDPQGQNVHYFWVISRNAEFLNSTETIDRIARIDEGTSLSIPYADLDAFLAANGVGQGESVTLYHAIAASDGSAITSSTVRSVTLTRSTTNQAPFVAAPVADFLHLLDDGLIKQSLADVFQDPDGDPLSYSAVSSDEDLALVNIEADTLIITPLEVGEVTISMSASDGKGDLAEDAFVLTINQAPQIVNTIEDLTFIEGDDAFSSDLTTVFFDQDAISFTAESDNDAIAAAELDAAGKVLTITPGQVGATTVSVTASDERGSNTTLVIQVLVQADMITPPQSVVENVSIAFGNPDLETSYKLVGLPGTVNLPLRDAVGGTPEVDWIAFRDSGGEGEREQYFVRFDGSSSFNFVPGRGFWLLSKSTWNRTETRSTVPLSVDGTYSIPLQPGWNIIANPYDIDVPWQAVTQTNTISQSLHRWTGRFQQTSVFSSARSGEAFYFFNSEGLTEIKIPYIPVPTATAAETRIPAITVSASTGNEIFSTVRLGYHEEALEGEDPLDQIAPPRAFESVSLRAIEPKAPETSRKRLLAEQYEPAGQSGYRYEISLVAPEGEPVTISVEDIESLELSQEIVLFDKTLAKRYDIHKDPSFTIWPTSSALNFVLLIGDDAYISSEAHEILPLEVALLPNYPNPFDSHTTIEFALPEPKSVRLVVYDALGRQVRTLRNGFMDAGHHSVMWDGRNDAGSTMGSGLYFFQLLLPESRLVRSAIVRH